MCSSCTLYDQIRRRVPDDRDRADADVSQSLKGRFDGDRRFRGPHFQHPSELGIVSQQAINQVVIIQGRQLICRHSVDCDDDRLLLAKPAVLAELRFRFTQGDHFHDVP